MTGTFPESFHTDAAPYLVTKGCMDPQKSAIKYVFFGAGDTFMMQMKDGMVFFRGIPPALRQAITTQNNRRFMLRKSTALCPWDSRFFFACFEPMESWSIASHSYSWNIWPNGYLSDIVIRGVLEGLMPASITASSCCMDSQFFISPMPLIPWPAKRGVPDSWCRPSAGPLPKAISSATRSTGQSTAVWTPPWGQNTFRCADGRNEENFARAPAIPPM